MKRITFLALIATTPAFADETRQLDAHVHGIGELNIAIDRNEIAMEFHAPGADIVGFEHQAESQEDLAKIEEAIKFLQTPLNLFIVSDEAKCVVTQTSVGLEDDDDHGHDEHSEKEHDHEEHGKKSSHSEFHAEYALTCENPDALTSIEFAYFTAFENAVEVDVQIVTAAGAQAFEVSRNDPVLDLSALN